jgi:hypothetical protein
MIQLNKLNNIHHGVILNLHEFDTLKCVEISECKLCFNMFTVTYKCSDCQSSFC